MLRNGQNTLLVTSTLNNRTEEFHVDSEVYLKRRRIKDLELLKLFLSDYILNYSDKKEKLPENNKVAINLLYSKVLNFIDLKMFKFSELQVHSLKILIREINSGHFGLTNSCFLDSLKGTLLFSNKFEFFGKVKSLKIQGLLNFTLAVKRREKKNHFEKYIGVGYKDKGTAKNETEDGTPSWEEITGTGLHRLREVKASNTSWVETKSFSDQKETKSLEVGVTRFGNPSRLHLRKFSGEHGIVIWLDDCDKLSSHSSVCFNSILKCFGSFVPTKLRNRSGIIIYSTRSRLLGVISR